MINAHPNSHESSGLEKILEHRLICELSSCLWLDGCRDFEVLRSEVDSHGYDVVVEALGVLRHIQLKSMVAGGKKRHVSINLRLAAKASGCVIWYDYDPATLKLGPFRWFGTYPGLGLPNVGDKIGRHSKGDATGSKNLRLGHREVRKSQFTQVGTIGGLVPYLFGQSSLAEIQMLRAHVQEQPEPDGPTMLRELWLGRFQAIPEDLRWEDSVALAHLDGYDLAGRMGLGDPLDFEWRQLQNAQKTGSWLGGPAVLWTTLFLEHRRWRMAPLDPDPAMLTLLDGLCLQLVAAIKAAL